MARRKIKEEPLETKAPIRQAKFFVAGGNYNPSGYKCSGIEIMRDKNESTEELRTRCRASVTWPDANTVHVFTPIN